MMMINSKALLKKYSNTGFLFGETFSSSDANEGYSVVKHLTEILSLLAIGTQHGAYNNFAVKTNADGGQLWKKKNQSVGDALYSVVESQAVDMQLQVL